mgnify:CR=1 FL=1
MPTSNEVLAVLTALATSGWIREAGFVVAVTLLAWPIARLAERRIVDPEGSPREVSAVRNLVRAIVWPVLALGLSAIGLELLRRARPDWIGESNGVLPILGFFLILRLVRQLLRETLPVGPQRRRLRRGLAPTLFVLAVLQQLELLGPTVNFLQTPLFTLGDTPISAFSILVAIGIILGASVLGQIVQALISRRVLPRLGVEVAVADAIGTVLRYTLVVFGVLIGVELVGFDMTTLKIAFGALGVGIGFGLQNVVNNFTSGLILLFERTVKRGDILTVEGQDGRVQHVGLRSSVIRTREGDDLILPNSILVENMVTNYSYGDDLKRVDVALGVSYASDPNTVREVLLEVAKKHDDVLPTPPPTVFFESFGDSSIDFTLRCWIRDAWKYPTVHSHLMFSVWYALKDAGIEIPFPQRDLHLRSAIPLPVRTESPRENEAEG